MNDMLKMSKISLTFEIDRVRSNKAIEQLELLNPDQNKRKGFKIKSTNIARYVVNPASGIIDPLKIANIDIMLTVHPEEDISRIQDKFRLYCLEITDDNVNKQNIDQYIRKCENNITKASIGVKVIEKHDKNTNRLDSLTLDQRPNPTDIMSQISKDNVIKPDSVLFESIIPPSNKNIYCDSQNSNMNFKSNGVESLLIEKENEILKLKETNSMLEKDITMMRGKILLGDQNKIAVKNNETRVWKFMLVLLFGLIIGSMLNSA